MTGSSRLARQHLLLRLRPLNRILQRLIGEQATRAAKLDRPDLTHLCVTDKQVMQLLGAVSQLSMAPSEQPIDTSLTDEEQRWEAKLRQQASADDSELPLDVLAQSVSLDSCEILAVLAVAAPELTRDYERIYAYVSDDLNRRFPTVELLCRILSPQWIERLAALGPFGKLRTSGLLETFGELSTGARAQLRLGPGVLEYMIGSNSAMCGFWQAPNSETIVSPFRSALLPECKRIGLALANRAVDFVGLWGSDDTNPILAANEIAKAARRSLQPFRQGMHTSLQTSLRNALHTASINKSILLIDMDIAGNLDGPVIEDLSRCRVPVVLLGKSPWRPTELLAKRAYVELMLSSSDHASLQQGWQQELPEIDPARATELASRFRMSNQEMTAVARVARSTALVKSNGKPAEVEDQVEQACMTVASKKPGKFLGAVHCRRGPDDLILPGELHKQVLEIAAFADALPQVSEDWGFGRLASGKLGIKCLFTGDPGTGKTLAAEVIASLVGTPLLKVNLAELVSKWVGETEKNLDAAFQEALSSHAILFFDEADSLFGKRGEVKTGVDRYANLEVSHLLQKFEDHAGLVILASNLKNNIDAAFLRRFQTLLHFPRPTEAERLRLWEMAFPEQAPLDPQVNRKQFANLDLTGAGIVSAARTAALFAASEKSKYIDTRHIVRAIARQFRQEGRVLSPMDLGQHAAWLKETA